jgi:hypothetical protein
MCGRAEEPRLFRPSLVIEAFSVKILKENGRVVPVAKMFETAK